MVNAPDRSLKVAQPVCKFENINRIPKGGLYKRWFLGKQTAAISEGGWDNLPKCKQNQNPKRQGSPTQQPKRVQSKLGRERAMFGADDND